MTEARDAFPGNPILPQYFGDGWTEQVDPGESREGAWDWVSPHRRAVSGLLQVIKFWCSERQAADGQFGGGWGDDVEVWRNWTPILLGYKVRELGEVIKKVGVISVLLICGLEECWLRLAAGSLSRPRMSGGYTSKLTDVEHSAEETGDPLTSILLIGMILSVNSDGITSCLDPENVTYRSWAATTIPQLALNLWTGTNHKGRLQFKSTYFSSALVSENILVACDTAYHTRQAGHKTIETVTLLSEFCSPLC